MIDILNLALPYFAPIFIGFARGKAKGLPEQGLEWMNFFLLYVSLPALLFGITSKTPFEELNNPPFLIATTLGTASAFVLALFAARLIGCLQLREATLGGFQGLMGTSATWGPLWRSPYSAPRPPRHRADLLLRQHLSVYDCAATGRIDGKQTSIVMAHTR